MTLARNTNAWKITCLKRLDETVPRNIGTCSGPAARDNRVVGNLGVAGPETGAVLAGRDGVVLEGD